MNSKPHSEHWDEVVSTARSIIDGELSEGRLWFERAEAVVEVAMRLEDLEEQLEATRKALSAYRSALRSGERESPRLAAMGDVALDVSNPACKHEWVDARNEIVESGEICVKCHAIRASNLASEPEAS